jgi:hypothetical protein
MDWGLIEQSPNRPAADDDVRRRYYRITREGKAAAAAEAARMDRLLADARRHGLIPSEGG